MIPPTLRTPESPDDALETLQAAMRALEEIPGRVAAMTARLPGELEDLGARLEAELASERDEDLQGLSSRLAALTIEAASGPVTARLSEGRLVLSAPPTTLRGRAANQLLQHAERVLVRLRVASSQEVTTTARDFREENLPEGDNPDLGRELADAVRGLPQDLPRELVSAVPAEWIQRLRSASVEGEDPRRAVRVRLSGDGAVSVVATPRAKHLGHSTPLLQAVAGAYEQALSRWGERVNEAVAELDLEPSDDVGAAVVRLVRSAEETW